MKFGLNKDRLVSGLIGVFLSAAGISGGDLALDSLTGQKEFTVTMTKHEAQAFSHGQGDMTKPYIDLARQIDPYVTQGGQSAKVTVETESKTTKITHSPVVIEATQAPN